MNLAVCVCRKGEIRKTTCALFFWMFLLFFRSGIASAAEPFELHVLDVGQGQCVLVEADDHYMLIDGGGRESSSFVISYLKQEGISEFDYIVASHYGEDHIAGSIGALKIFKTGMLLLPSYAGEGSIYESFSTAAISNCCDIYHPRVGDYFGLGDAVIVVVGPVRNDYEHENDKSLALKIIYGDTSFLICGDAEQESELDMAGEEISADLVVVNHHGSGTSTTDVFLDAVYPEYAVISCGTGNSYGHPAMETMQRLQQRDILMFRTDKQGTIVASSDGVDIWFNTYPCDDWSSGWIEVDPSESTDTYEEITRTSPSEMLPEEAVEEIDGKTMSRYVCNTNTKKFHFPDCKSVRQMREENRLYTDLSREELLAEGYEPCGNCTP